MYWVQTSSRSQNHDEYCSVDFYCDYQISSAAKRDESLPRVSFQILYKIYRGHIQRCMDIYSWLKTLIWSSFPKLPAMYLAQVKELLDNVLNEYTRWINTCSFLYFRLESFQNEHVN